MISTQSVSGGLSDSKIFILTIYTRKKKEEKKEKETEKDV